MLNNITKILIPVDFSDASVQALIYASLIGTSTQAELVLLHIREEYFTDVDHLILDRATHPDVYKLVDTKLSEIKDKQSDLQEISFTVMVSTGKIHRSIQRIANQIQADLVIMGTSDVTKGFVNGVKRYMLGSNTVRTVEVCDIPIITLHTENQKKELKCIVLPIDIEDASTTDKVDYVKKLASLYDAKVHVLAITDDSAPEDNVNQMKITLKEVCDDFKINNLKIETHILHTEDIASDIIDYSVRNRADLIVIMSKKSKSIDQLFLQSEERIIIENHRIPVLSLKPAFDKE